MHACELKSEAEERDSADEGVRLLTCRNCGGRLIPAGYAFASREGFWLGQKCAGCDAESVLSRGLKGSPF